MTLPREVVPGRYYLLTRRCTQRQFLLRPDAATNNAFIYCLAIAAQRHGVDVLLPCAMSNHYHAVVYDRHGHLPLFTQHFHRLLAKCQNALRGRWENLWASEQTSAVRLVDRADVLKKLLYVATNPVKDGLVDKVHHWPGVNGLTALVRSRPLYAVRPPHFFRAKGSMPATANLTLALPPELEDPSALIAELRAGVAAKELTLQAERQRAGGRVLGRRAVQAQPWKSAPSTPEPRRNLRPTVAAENYWARVEALARNREFVRAYRGARARWLAGEAVTFPAGTYWLRRHAGVATTA